MNGIGAGSQIGQRVNDAPKPTASSHNTLDVAVERLSTLVAVTDKIKSRLNHNLQPELCGGEAGGKIPAEPSLIEKLDGIHQLITWLESNVQAIGAVIG